MRFAWFLPLCRASLRIMRVLLVVGMMYDTILASM